MAISNNFRALWWKKIRKEANGAKLAILNQFRPLQQGNTGKVQKQPKLAIPNPSVGKYWKSYKIAKIGHSESIWTTLIGKCWKVAKWPKLAILNQFGPLW